MTPVRRFRTAGPLAGLLLLVAPRAGQDGLFCEEAPGPLPAHAVSTPVDRPELGLALGCNVGNARDNTPFPFEVLADFVPVTDDDSLGFHVVYSPRQSPEQDGTVGNNASIFVLPLVGDELLVFGAGYGDPFGGPYSALFDAATDAAKLDIVVRNCLGRTPADARIRFLAPHGHGDHANGPFFRELRALGYTILEIAFQQADYQILSSFPGWTQADRRLFRTLPDARTCGEALETYDSPLGRLWVVSRPGHTEGSIDLVIDVRNDPNDRFLVRGSLAGGTCSAPPSGTRVAVNPHGNTILLSAPFSRTLPPSLDGASPATAGAGALVTLTGTGFLANGAGDSTVLFGGVPASEVDVVSDAQLSCRVPPGIGGGTVDLVLRNANGQGTLPAGFTYPTTSTLRSVTPALGTSLGGTSVVVEGTGFLAGSPGSLRVTFGGAAATGVQVASDGRLACLTPPGTPGESVDVVVSSDASAALLPGGYAYRPLPVIETVFPGSVSSLGSAVKLLGTGFPAATPVVRFGSIPSPLVVVDSPTQIRCFAPPGVPGSTVDVSLSSVNGPATLAAGLAYHPLPALASVAPSAGPGTGGTSVTLRGSGFLDDGAGDPTVTFGGLPAEDLVVLDDASLVCRTPAAPADGPVDVVLSNRNGSATLTAGFSYGSALRLDVLAPDHGAPGGGTIVLLYGEGFLASPADLQVLFGGRPAPAVRVDSDVRVACRTPRAAAAGTVDVTVVSGGRSATLPAAYAYDAPPLRLDSVSPSHGSSLGGCLLTLRGTGFLDFGAGAPAVLVGGAPALEPLVQDDGTIVAVAPPGAAGTSVAVRVANAFGSAVLDAAFAYDATPVVSDVSPPTAAAAGGEVVLVLGSGFATGPAGTNVVTFGGVPAEVVAVLSDAQLSVTVPPGEPSASAPVEVANASGRTPVAAPFRYADPPALASLVPDHASARGGAIVVLGGARLLGPDGALPGLRFGALPATGVGLDGAGNLVCQVPAGPPGAAVDVAVENAYGGALLAGRFRYHPAPTLSAVAPSAGAPEGGQRVVLSGTGFLALDAGAPQVYFGPRPALAVEVLSDGEIACATPVGVPGRTVSVGVSNANGTAILAGAFTYGGALALTSVDPASGPAAGGTPVVLLGAGFAGARVTGVTFDGSAADSVLVLDDGRVACVTPPGTPGASVAVTVVGEASSATLPGGFAYAAGPVLASVEPPEGPSAGGGTVTLLGSGFLGGGVPEVLFGAARAVGVEVRDDATITCTVPSGAAGTTVDVGVRTASAAALLPQGYRYLAAPAVTAVTPDHGTSLGGAAVEVQGSGFSVAGPLSVRFGGVSASGVVVLDDTTLACRAPAGTPGTSVGVGVTTSGGFGGLPGAFRFHARPRLTAVAPDTVPAAGGTPLTLSGTGFVADDAGPPTVVVGGLPVAGVQVVDDTTLVLAAPPGVPGSAVDVVVTNANGGTRLAAGLAYRPLPTLSAVEPSEGTPLGGTAVTIHGTGFLDPAAELGLALGGAPLADVVVLDGTTLRATTPPGTSGAVVALSLSAPGGSALLPQAFRYRRAPVLAGLDPPGTSSLGGALLLLRGSGFAEEPGDLAVRIGATDLGAPVVRDDATLEVLAPPGEPGTAVDVELASSNGTTRLPGALRYHALPLVTGVLPAQGTSLGGTPVRLQGSGFLVDAAGPPLVRIGGVEAPDVSLLDDANLVVVTPPGPPGALVDVALSNGNGAALAARAFRYHAEPTLASVSPSEGPDWGGQALVLEGSGFQAGQAGPPEVSLGGTLVPGVVVLDDAHVACVAPPLPPGPVDVSLSNANGSALLRAGYLVVRSLRVTSVSPDAGRSSGKTLVALTGSGFDAGADLSVLFGADEARNVVLLDDRNLSCDSPPGVPGTTVDVTVANALGVATLPLAFTYVNGSAALDGAEPPGGDPGLWTAVLLTGSGFDALDESELAVAFGAELARDVRRLDDGSIACLAPPGAPGETLDLRVADGELELELASGWRHASGVAGDLDDDGLADLLLPAREGGPGVLLGGAPEALPVALPEPGGAGPWLLGAGDLDGDGVPDLVAARPEVDGGGTHLAVAHGPLRRDGATLRARALEERTLPAPRPAGLLVTDLDGDHRAEALLVAAPELDGGPGTVWIVRAAGLGARAPGARAPLPAPPALLAASVPASRAFGAALAAADVDGDGAPELLVGDPGDDAAGADAGALHVLPLLPGGRAPSPPLSGPGPGARFGAALALRASVAERPLLVGAPGDGDGGAVVALPLDADAWTRDALLDGVLVRGTRGRSLGRTLAVLAAADGPLALALDERGGLHSLDADAADAALGILARPFAEAPGALRLAVLSAPGGGERALLLDQADELLGEVRAGSAARPELLGAGR